MTHHNYDTKHIKPVQAELLRVVISTVKKDRIVDFVASGDVTKAPCHVLITIKDNEITFTSLAPENMIIGSYPYLDAVNTCYYCFVEDIEVTRDIKQEVTNHLLNKYSLKEKQLFFKKINYCKSLLLEPYLSKATAEYILVDKGIIYSFVDEYANSLDYRIDEDDITPLFDAYINSIKVV